MTDYPIEGILPALAEEHAVAWLYCRDDGSKDLLLDCNSEYARNLLELGATGTPLYAHPPAAPDTVTLDRTLAERLMEYAGHADDCQIMTHGVWSDPIPCTCGYSGIATKLTEALK